MKKLHTNLKRFHGCKTYFITTVTYDRQPYFYNPQFCKILWNNIFYAQKIKPFKLYGFVIMPDHLHILLKPNNDYNISQIIKNIKRTSSLHINKLLKHGVDANIYSHLHENTKILPPKFKWQKSYHDRTIRKQSNELQRYINYIKNNPIHHSQIKNAKKYKWIYVE